MFITVINLIKLLLEYSNSSFGKLKAKEFAILIIFNIFISLKLVIIALQHV